MQSVIVLFDLLMLILGALLIARVIRPIFARPADLFEKVKPVNPTWSKEAKPRHYELQALGDEALVAYNAGRVGLAKRLYEIALEKTQLEEYRSATTEEQIHQLRRGLGLIHMGLGAYTEASRLLLQAGDHERAAICFFFLERDDEAIQQLRLFRTPTSLVRGLFLAQHYLEALQVMRESCPMGFCEFEIAAASLVALGRDMAPGQTEGLADSNLEPLRQAILSEFCTWEHVVAVGRELLERMSPRDYFAKRFFGFSVHDEKADTSCTEKELSAALRAASATYSRDLIKRENAEQAHKRKREEAEQVHERLLFLLKGRRRKKWSEAQRLLSERLSDTSLFEPWEALRHPYGERLGELYFDVLVAGGSTQEAIKWVRTHEETLLDSLLIKVLNLKVLLGMDMNGAEAFHLWLERYRWRRGRPVWKYPLERNQLIERRLSVVRARLGIGNLLGYMTESCAGKDSYRTSWDPQMFELFANSWKRHLSVLNQTWLRPHLDSFYLFREISVAPEFRGIGLQLFEDLEETLKVNLRHSGISVQDWRWVGQTQMVCALREVFGVSEVIAEGAPDWLRGMRFDAWIPSKNLAVECQGIQHFHPVEMFGGLKTLKTTQEHDRLKLDLARSRGITIEYIRYDEDIYLRVKEIARRYMHTSEWS